MCTLDHPDDFFDGTYHDTTLFLPHSERFWILAGVAALVHQTEYFTEEFGSNSEKRVLIVWTNRGESQGMPFLTNRPIIGTYLRHLSRMTDGMSSDLLRLISLSFFREG